MSTVTLAIGRPTLVDRIFSRTLAVDLVLIAAGAALTAIAAQIAVPMFPVPITGQTLAVLLVGMSLGAVRGGLSMGLYAALGIVGLPVFSDASSGWGVIAGPTGGYIIGFVLAAVLTGWLAQLTWDRKVLKAFLAFLAGTAVTFIAGNIWLAAWLGAAGFPNDLDSVLRAGLYPFIIGGVIKAALGAGILSAAWFAVERGDKRADATEA
ncbi:biotin transporter BioY [Leifsonia sp. H3M29-4]|uniref:biotin transporter BioY n=1 Tax=Salinibacterium metalliresistens TaxID=3031321 RepID=UPI0023DCCD78|nr:biotin transporter BioY [Salinibacterium metalliresistens]MDF1479889.1 biotin transporter BioY [Salinibacterium metalliresistens]